MRPLRGSALWVTFAGLVHVLSQSAVAQDTRDAAPIETGPRVLRAINEAPVDRTLPVSVTVRPTAAGGSYTNTILVTGYWPPSNEMVRHFSANPLQNPEWVGENWENSGFNVYSYFPEFPNGGPNYGRGEGDFEVDYQDTSSDWWPLVEALKPVAIVTFSRAGNDRDWEMEGGNGNYTANLWSNDYLDPRKPTPELPSDQEPPPNDRFSSQPMQTIIDAVNTEMPALNGFIATFDNGRFLSNYIGYHGNWWRDLHADPSDSAYCVSAGHIHVGYAMSLEQAVDATNLTMRIVIDNLQQILQHPGDMNCDATVSVSDINPFIMALTDSDSYPATYPGCPIINGDFNGDGAVTVGDINGFVASLTGP